MKKFLIIFGTFILIIITSGTIFKLMHWPGAGPLLVIGMFFFSCFFLPIFFILRMIDGKTALNIITNIFALISTNSLFVGVLFKIMHWPGAGPMIVLGATFFICPTLILYMIQQFKEYDRKFREFWRTVVLAVLVSVFLIFWGTGVSRNILVAFLKVEDATLETNKDLKEYNAFMLTNLKQKYSHDSVYASPIRNIEHQTIVIFDYIEDVKSELVQYVEHSPEVSANHWDINSKDNYDIPTHYLGTSESAKGVELLNNLNDYKIDLKNQLKDIPFGNPDIVDELGDFGIKTELKPEMTDGYQMSWNEGMFNQQTVVGTLALLTAIQNEVLNAEFKCLKVISLNGRKFNISVKVSIPGGDSTGTRIKIMKNGIVERMIESEGVKYPVALDFNSNYLIESSKDGYITKVIYFNTNVPEGREQEEFAYFTVTVELFKGKEDVDASKPVGGVKYDAKSDDFQKVIN